MKASPFKYESPAQSHVAGGRLDFRNFVEVRGPRGGRMVIDGFALHARLSITVATATTEGEDLYRAFKTVTISEKDGTRRLNNVPGDALRLISYAHNGADCTFEHADFAAGTATINLTCYVPLAKRYAYEPRDFSMAAELLDAVTIECADGTNMSLGTSVVTVNSGTYWVVAECHEEMSIIQHSQDVWTIRDFPTAGATQLELAIGGGRLHDLYLYVPGQVGGQTLANLDQVWLEHLMPKPLKKDPTLSTFYQRRRNEAQNFITTTGGALRTNPFTGTTLRACAVLLTTGNKAYEGPVRNEVQIQLTNTADLPAAARVIARTIMPRNQRAREALMRRYGVSSSYVKTAGRTRRDAGSWDPSHVDYLPEKFTR